jgi:ferredoxin-nitrite reductase
VPAIFDRLREANIEHRQTGMDNVRGVMGCALAGLSQHESLDASPITRSLTNRLVGDKAFTNLPRKFNVSISGCVDNCVPAASQDLALVPAMRETANERKLGFNVLVGGKMGSGGFTPARSLDVFVGPDQAEELSVQVILLFSDHGLRETRARARLAFLLDEWGIDRFHAELEARCGWSLGPAGLDLRRTYETDHIGVTPLLEGDRYAVGLAVPVGRLKAVEVDQLADLAEEYGDGTVRLTPAQNVVLTGVPGGRLRALFDEPLLAVLRHDPPPSVRGTVACTGIGLCDLALTDTKVHALAVARQLETVLPGRPLSIHWSGCPAGCGNHQAADIGLQGGKARIGERVEEVYQIFVGGRAGPVARPGQQILAQVPAADVPAILERLASAHANGADLLEVGPALVGGTGRAEQATVEAA